MKTSRKLPFILAAVVIGIAASCASTGNFMPLAQNETVIGTVQATFVARNTLNGRDAINTQAYIKLLETAQQQYSGNGSGSPGIDIRDIVWVSGREIDSQNKEYAVTGKVIQVP
ncbi:hypothetical protein Holit_00848 [Hollandina sp. SP2]